jgi:hypothetical protein
MTPFRGMGANMALRDAAALRRALVKVARGEALLLGALANYEREMIEQGSAPFVCHSKTWNASIPKVSGKFSRTSRSV